jgi:apolipoprotein N-acyltransferase
MSGSVSLRQPPTLVPAGWAWLIAIGSGAMLSLAYPPIGFGPYALIAVACLLVALRGRGALRGFLLGTVAGFTYFAFLMLWMQVIGLDAWLLLAAYCGLWIGFIGFGATLVMRLPLWPIWFAGLWVLSEGLRGRVPFGGYPWGELAFSQADQDIARWSHFIGMAGFSGLLAVIAGAGLAAILAAHAGRRTPAILWSSVVVLPFLVAAIWQPPPGGDTIGGPPTEHIAIVQGGTPQLGMGALDVRRVVLENHVQQTLDLAAAIDAGEVPQPAFVLWPENSTDIDPFGDATVAADIQRAADAVGAPIVVGAVIAVPDVPGAAKNVGIVWNPETGPAELYVKNRPVPFGEFIPFREQLAPIIGRFERIPRDFVAGDQPGVLTPGGVLIGNVICFEVAYEDVINAVVSGGARVITVQTNNATYGNTAQPAQQFDIERMRSLQTGRSVVIAATTGISAVIGPDGTPLEVIAENEVGFAVVDVPLRGQVPPSAVTGPISEFLFVSAGLLALLVVLIGLTVRRVRAT